MSVATCLHGHVRVVHGPNNDVFDGLVSLSVGRVRLSLIHAFNIPDGAAAFVNGERVPLEHRLNSQDFLEFVHERGRKGASDNRDEYFFGSSDPQLKLNEILFRLRRLEELIAQVLKQQAPSKEFYTVEEFGKLVDLAPYTVREHCRLGRLHAEKAACGRGNIPEWRIPHAELVRYRSHGLRPIPKYSG
jgi:hypothetical protein